MVSRRQSLATRSHRVSVIIAIIAVLSLLAAALVHTFDTTIVRSIADQRSAGLVDTCTTLSQQGGFVTIMVVTTALGLVASYYLQTLRALLATLVTVALTSGLTTVLKNIFRRPRPDNPIAVYHVNGYSFPSGHSSITMSLAVAIILLLATSRSVPGRWLVATATVLVTIAAAIGLSRPCLGVHYPSDVLGGWTVGALCALLVVHGVMRPAT